MPRTDPDAPHGRDANGEPNAPYGYTVDGKPRKSNRGARPGQKGNANSAATAGMSRSNLTDNQRKNLLLELADTLFVTPLAGASRSSAVARRIGQKQADALAADAFVVDHFAPGVADGVIVAAQANPGLLSWMDTIEEKAPYLLLAQVGVQMTKAIVANHTRPDPQMVRAGRAKAGLNLKRKMDAIEAEAQAAGIQYDLDASVVEGGPGDGHAGT